MAGPSESERDPALFEVAGRRIVVSEVVRAAEVRGRIHEPRATFVADLALQQACEGRGETLDPADVERACDDWRYERGLLTAEETEAWFAARGLSLSELDAFCRRRLWRDRAESRGPPAPVRPSTSTRSLGPAFLADLMLSGEMDRLAHELACRLADAESRPGDGPPPPREVEAARRAFLKRQGLDEAVLPGWLAQSGTSPGELDRLLALEVAFRSHCAALLTPEARDRVRRSLQIPLIRVGLESVTVGTMDAAREVVLCILEDGRSMSDLAAENGLAYESGSVVLEELDEDTQGAVLSAAPGDLLAPVEEESEIRVRRVVAKREPEESDPETMARVDREVLDLHFADVTAKHVRRLLLDATVA